MKQIWILLVMGLIGCTASTQPSTATSEETESQKNIHEVLSVADFKSKLTSEQEIQLVDVRTANECASGIIENARNLDFYDSSFKEELAKLDKTKPLMLYCRSGGRSGKASEIAVGLGFQEIYDLEGGYTAWSAQ